MPMTTKRVADGPPSEAPAGQEWWFFVCETDLEQRMNGGAVRWWLQGAGSKADGERAKKWQH